MNIKKYFSILFSFLFWLRFTNLREYTGFSYDKDGNLLIEYTFKYKRAAGSFLATDLQKSTELLTSFNQRDCFKIGGLLANREICSTDSFLPKEKLNPKLFWWPYLILSILFVMSLILSNLFAKRIITIFGRIFPGGILIFPMTFAILDIITECYGLKLARKVIYLNVAMQIIFALIASSFLLLQPAPSAEHFNSSYMVVFSSSIRIVLAMIVASIIADLTNCTLFSFIKNRFHSVPIVGSLAIRCVFSTAIAEFLFSLIWVLIFFAGTLPVSKMLSLVVDQYFIKVAYEVMALPLTYLIVYFIKNKFYKKVAIV